jgi:hypothetical protein
MNGRGATARTLESSLRAELVKLLRSLMKRGNIGDVIIRPEETGPRRLVDRLMALGMLQWVEDGCGGARLTRRGRQLMREVFRRGVEDVFRPREIPIYDRKDKVLYWCGHVIKTWDRKPTSQEPILGAFEEQDWQYIIDDPTLRDPKKHSKERLRQIVRSLNEKLKPGTIRFNTTHSGTAVRWAPVGRTKKRKTPG